MTAVQVKPKRVRQKSVAVSPYNIARLAALEPRSGLHALSRQLRRRHRALQRRISRRARKPTRCRRSRSDQRRDPPLAHSRDGGG